ncbi:AAEL005448-PA [Aedes aegypti]|uniref:AAEL005448-PA n=1 Tax=Aedes aegypti TaxID=7159 RepID=Q179Z3_AEDAE|nr:AAEL005448-PA [Aedes aegypti]
MEENRLYTDWEIIVSNAHASFTEARAKGEADLLEVPHSCLRIGREIGKGAFGHVFIANASKLPHCNGPKLVAVKQLKKCPKRKPEFEEFLDEIAMMKQVGKHPNIVALLGCCTLKEPLTMIMEYIGCGDLVTMYTTLSGPNDSSREHSALEYLLDHKELHDFARQIACGMKHLEEKNITHRDLAARNILIDEKKTLKISDFGLSRTGIYVNTRNKKVPLRWLSIEAMRDHLYSSKSDVWAFGIVLWEIGTLGGYPYPTVSNHELLSFLHNGNRLDRPENCSAELYELMLHCWKAEPDDRPSFADIYKSLEPHRRIYIDFNEIEPTYVFPPTSDQIKKILVNNK